MLYIAYAVVKKKGKGIIGLKLARLPDMQLMGILSLEAIYYANLQVHNVQVVKKSSKRYSAIGLHGDLSRYPVVDENNNPLYTRALTILGFTEYTGIKTHKEWHGAVCKEIKTRERMKGYYAISCSGYIGYFTTEKLLQIGSRYKITNAVIRGTTITALSLSGVTKPEFYKFASSSRIVDAVRVDIVRLEEQDAVSRLHMAIKNAELNHDIVLNDVDIRKIRVLADIVAQPSLVSLVSPEENEVIQKAYERAMLECTLSEGSKKAVDKLYDKVCGTDKAVAKLLGLDKDKLTQTDVFNSMLGTISNPLEQYFNLVQYRNMSSGAKNLYTNAIIGEQQVSSALTLLSKKLNFTLGGFEHRLKSPSSLVEKVYERSKLEGIKPAEAMENTYDVLRYTLIFECSDKSDLYVDNTRIAFGALCESFRYKLDYFRNYWVVPNNPYNGVNAGMCLPTTKFELQVHTPESFDLKNNAMHDLYEQIRRSGISDYEKESLNAKMFELSSKLRRPAGIDTLQIGEDK